MTLETNKIASKETIVATALGYLAKGWSVIPCGQDKRPIVSWKDYQTRLPRVEEILEWWDKNPTAQVGIITGKISNLLVVDIEEGGDFDLIKDETFVVKTGGNGRHYYFKNDETFQNAVRLLPLMDIRAEGGYVIAPPSATTKGNYSVIRECKEIPFMSSHTLGILNTAKKPAYEPSVYKQVPVENVDLVADYAGYGKGQRNDQMAKHIGSILARTHPSVWDTIGWNIALQSNQKNQPPLPERELRATWDSLKSRERQQNPNGRIYTPTYKKSVSYGPTEVKITKPDIDVEPRRAVIMHASEVAENQIIDTDHTFSTGMQIFDDALLGGFSPGDLIVVAGKPGVGKTTVVQDWSVVLSSGCNGKYEKQPSLWFSYEVLARPLWTKFKNMGANNDTPIFLPSYNESGDSEWVVEMIDMGITQKGIKVVAIDHIGFLKPPRGNYSNQADAITHTARMLKRMGVNNGIIFMIPVHVKKTRGTEFDLDDIKDSSGIAQEADTVFFIDRIKSNGVASEQAKIILSKNRKTGVSASGIFDFKFGKYFYNETATRLEGLNNEAVRKATEDWDKEDREKEKVEEKSEVVEEIEKKEIPLSFWELPENKNLPYADDDTF